MDDKLNSDAVKAALEDATPGPWSVGKAGPNKCPTVGTQKGLLLAMVSYGDSHPTEANARLIAMAPDLATAYLALAEENERLRNLVHAIVASGDAPYDWMNEAEAAIGMDEMQARATEG